MALAYVAAELLAGDVVRALGQLRGEHALDGAGLDGEVAALGARGQQGMAAGGRNGKTAQSDKRVATGEAMFG